jgi:hypothetical protein
MNRRSFLKGSILAATGLRLNQTRPLKTRHLIFIVNGNGVRKKEYYEDAALSPNIHRMTSEGFVFTEDHCDSVASHAAAFAELVRGLPDYLYLNCRSSQLIPTIMHERRPRILVLHETGHDVGHESYEKYLDAVKATDQRAGRIFDWVKNDRYFSQNTAIVLRPEFGRDDEINSSGELHHSEGFYYAHRVARIFWGPDVTPGVDRTRVINRRDMAPMLAELVNHEFPL